MDCVPVLLCGIFLYLLLWEDTQHSVLYRYYTSYFVLFKDSRGETPLSPILKPFLIMQGNCTAIGLCSALKMNQRCGSGAAQAYGWEARQSPPEWGGIWLYNASNRHRLLWFLLLQRRLQDFRSTRLEAFASRISLLSALEVSLLFREQPHPSRPPAFFLLGTWEEKAAGQRICARRSVGLRRLCSHVPHSLPIESFHPFSSPT